MVLRLKTRESRSLPDYQRASARSTFPLSPYSPPSRGVFCYGRARPPANHLRLTSAAPASIIRSMMNAEQYNRELAKVERELKAKGRPDIVLPARAGLVAPPTGAQQTHLELLQLCLPHLWRGGTEAEKARDMWECMMMDWINPAEPYQDLLPPPGARDGR